MDASGGERRGRRRAEGEWRGRAGKCRHGLEGSGMEGSAGKEGEGRARDGRREGQGRDLITEGSEGGERRRGEVSGVKGDGR